MAKFKITIVTLSAALLLFFAACVKEVADQNKQIEAQKVDLLKAKAEMRTSLQASADAIRVTGKKYFGQPHNGQFPDVGDFIKSIEQEVLAKNPQTDTKLIVLDKVWNPKTQSLKDYMSANGVSEKVIFYSNSIKESLESELGKFSEQIDKGNLDTKAMWEVSRQVLQNAEEKFINDPELSESDKLTLLASTTSGEVLAPAMFEVPLVDSLRLCKKSKF